MSRLPQSLRRLLGMYTGSIRILVLGLAFLAGMGILAMMAVTCLDVVLRLFGRPLTGAFDIVRISGALTIACALPYTTAIKGHVAIEFFFQKLGRRSRIAVDTTARLIGIGLFALLARQCIRYGHSLRASGQVSATLQIPIFWVPYVIGASCAVVVLVIVHNLLHPGREMIKP
jgi:TRAP-type C4-dicarboxylate transport system permease small subunit